MKPFNLMNFSFLGLFFAPFILTATLEEIERRRALETSLLSNLQAHHAAVVIETVPAVEVFGYTIRRHADDENNVDDEVVAPFLSNMSFDIHQHIFSYLNPLDLLSTRQLNHLYRSWSDYAIQAKICQYSPVFVLRDAWMNYGMCDFLSKYFKKGHINTDELLSAMEDIICKFPSDGRYPNSLSFLSFVYEHVNGINSSLPIFPSEVYSEAVTNLIHLDLPKTKAMLKNISVHFIFGSNFKDDEKEIRTKFIEETIELLTTKPSCQEIAAHLNFDPTLPVYSSDYWLLPPFFRAAMLNLILPLCDDEDRYIEAIELSSFSSVFPHRLLDQIEVKFPGLTNQFFSQIPSIYPAGQRELHRRGLGTHVAGLEYLLSRNVANPFKLEDLMVINPDIPRLMEAFLPCNTLSLTEIDMLVQMKDAGLFDGIQDIDLLQKIDLILSGKIRMKKIRNYSDFLISQIHNQG